MHRAAHVGAENGRLNRAQPRAKRKEFRTAVWDPYLTRNSLRIANHSAPFPEPAGRLTIQSYLSVSSASSLAASSSERFSISASSAANSASFAAGGNGEPLVVPLGTFGVVASLTPSDCSARYRARVAGVG